MTLKISALYQKVRITSGSLIIPIVSASLHAHPETLDESTILATGFSTGKNDTGLRVSVRDGKDLNDIGIWRLDQAIQNTPGVNIFSNGSNGTASSIFTRGTESDHTALYVDGVKLTHSRVFPFPAANILSGGSIQPGERIELLRGPQSALYGSDAIGGVLSLSLEQGSDHGINRTWMELGSFNSLTGGISFQGQEDKLSYNTFISWQQTSNDQADNDHQSLHAGLRLDYAVSGDTTIGTTLRVLNFDTELPALGFTPYATNETENIICSVYFESQLTEKWFARFSLGGYVSKFENVGGFGDSTVDTEHYNVDWKSRYAWNEQHETTTGIAISWLDTLNTGAGIAKKSERTESYYIQHRWHKQEQLDLLAGIRYDNYDDGEDSTTFRIAGSYQLSARARLHASLASAFRRPSVVDLYGFFGNGGNLNLKSEQSLGWDTGVAFDLNSTSQLDITYFSNEIDDLITNGPAPSFTAMNIHKARTKGIEISCRASFLDERIKTRLSYTWLEANNLTNRTRLLRRPSHTLTADIHSQVSDSLVLGAGVSWVADREDIDASTFARIDAKDYIVARIYGRYQLSEKVSLHGRVENLFDKQYAEIDGFPARGLGAFAGITVQW